jgi:hypothetical protein
MWKEGALELGWVVVQVEGTPTARSSRKLFFFFFEVHTITLHQKSAQDPGLY